MSVPAFVPEKVPAKLKRKAAPNPRYLTGDPSGWRFQKRLPREILPAHFALAGAAPIVRVQLGPLSRGRAKRLALQLAALCDATCAAAMDIGMTGPMPPSPLEDSEQKLVEHVIAACQNAIAGALAQPSRAAGFARKLTASLNTLQLVQGEVAKGQHGAGAIVANADTLTRGALLDVLKLSAQPGEALAALAAVTNVTPTSTPALPATEAKPLTFSAVSNAYIQMRIERDGESHADIATLRLRRQTFLDLIGDKPINQYLRSDLQSYVNRMQYWPADVTKRPADKSTLEILEANKDFSSQPMALKTMTDGFVANIRTMMRHGMQDHGYNDPFAEVQLSYPKILRDPTPREGIDADLLNRVFCDGIASGQLDESMLPLIASLTSRRIGLLTFMQGADIRKKNGVWIGQTSGVVKDAGVWRRVPIKTEESMTFFVLHNFLDEIGFISWARSQDRWIFASAHEHADPAKYMSKTMSNLLKRNGASRGEVFHSLRHRAIDHMREGRVDNRERRLQSGHALSDPHELYGFRALSPEACRKLADLPLSPDIDWSVFRGLDFDAMALRRRARGRRRKESRHDG